MEKPQKPEDKKGNPPTSTAAVTAAEKRANRASKQQDSVYQKKTRMFLREWFSQVNKVKCCYTNKAARSSWAPRTHTQTKAHPLSPLLSKTSDSTITFAQPLRTANYTITPFRLRKRTTTAFVKHTQHRPLHETAQRGPRQATPTRHLRPGHTIDK
jgi:hypothetical protein